jgi:hypothetical protein
VDRCHGKTKSGARCKRQVPEGTRFCSAHSDQAEGAEEAVDPGGTSQDLDALDTVILLAAAGAVLFVALTFRRFSWFL